MTTTLSEEGVVLVTSVCLSVCVTTTLSEEGVVLVTSACLSVCDNYVE